MSTGRITLGILAVIAGIFMIRLGEIDDSPGAGGIGIILIGIGVYLAIRKKKVKSKK